MKYFSVAHWALASMVFPSAQIFSTPRNFCFGVCFSCGYVCVLARVRLVVSAFVCAGVRANFFMESDRVNTFVYMFLLFLLTFLSVTFCAWLRLSLRLLHHSAVYARRCPSFGQVNLFFLGRTWRFLESYKFVFRFGSKRSNEHTMRTLRSWPNLI